jgi:SAM-dependent methyltransferase
MKSEEFNPAFSLIAPYYDTLMSFVNYPGWVTYIEHILKYHEKETRTIFDLACGTGVCLELWLKQGYQVIGLDRSLAMLQICKDRLNCFQNNTVCLINGDMRNFALNRGVPVMTCLYDSLNHLLTVDDVYQCMEHVHDSLCKNGLFIFDMNTVHCLRDEWGNNTFYRQDNNINSIWINIFNSDSYISSLKITLNITENSTIKVLREFHQERGYRLSLIRDMLTRLGFQVSLYRHLTFEPASEGDLRIMGVARK